jgi:hypothetical protein
MRPSALRALAASLLAISALTAAPAAHAQTALSQSFTLTSTTPLVSYTFAVTTAGEFSLYSDAPTIDPVIFLFSGTNVTDPAAFLARNDDGCTVGSFAFCQPSGAFANGLITRNLAVGTYTLSAAVCCTSIEQVQTGSVTFASEAPVTLNVASAAGVASAASSTVPEPGTWALMGTGLLGLAGVARRRRAQG